MSSRFCAIARRSADIKRSAPFLADLTPHIMRSLDMQSEVDNFKKGSMYTSPNKLDEYQYSQSSSSMDSESRTEARFQDTMRVPIEIDAQFDTIVISECIQALRDLSHLPSSRRSSLLRLHLINRIIYSISTDREVAVDDIDVLDVLLDNYCGSPSVRDACNNILLRSSTWLDHPRVFWKLKCRSELSDAVLVHFSNDSSMLADLLNRHSTCLLFKSRLLDLMISVNALLCDVARVVASLTQSLQRGSRETLQLKPLYSALVDASRDRSSPLWSLAESRDLVECMLTNKFIPSKPGLTTVAIANAILRTGGIRTHRSPLVYQILTDSLSLYDGTNACTLLEICYEYKLPSQLESGFSSRKKASYSSSAFIKKLISSLEKDPCKTDLESLSWLSTLLEHPTIEIKSSICLWNLIHDKFVEKIPDPIPCIRVLVSVERAGDTCNMRDTIERSLTPLAVLGLRRYLGENRAIGPVVNELTRSGKISSRIVDELIEHLVGRIRGHENVSLEDVVRVLKLGSSATDQARIQFLENYLVGQLLAHRDRSAFSEKFWVDLLCVTTNLNLAEFGIGKLHWPSLSLTDLIGVSRWISEDNEGWKKSAKNAVLPEDREKMNVEDLLLALRRKHTRIEQYSEYPDGRRDGNVAAAFCGVLFSFTLGLSAELVFPK